MMKAIIYTKYGSPDVLELKQLAKPVPKDNEVLVKVYSAGVNTTEPIVRGGKPFIARTGNGFIKPKSPILGLAVAGVIEEVGKDVKLYKPGDEIFASTSIGGGGYAEYRCLPEEGALVIKPSNMTFDEAAAVPYGILTALHFLRDKANIKSGQRILINGASGSIGTFAVQLARYFGAEVTGVCSTSNLNLVKSLGADFVFDYTKGDFTTTDRKYDIIFDTIGSSSFSRCKSLLTQKGIYLLTVPTLAIMLQMLWTKMASGKKAIFAASALRPISEKAKDLIFAKELIEAGNLKSVIDRSYAIEEIAEAHRYIEKGHKKGNVVMTLAHNNFS